MQTLGRMGAVWGVGGVALLLGFAVVRMTPASLAAFGQLRLIHWTVLVPYVALMTIGKGYFALQRGFSPRVAARARYLRDHPRWIHVAAAPLFCLGFLHATRRRRAVSIAIASAVVPAVLVVRTLAQPWRGIVSFGVVVGLAWGLAALVAFTYRAFADDDFAFPTDVPDPQRRRKA